VNLSEVWCVVTRLTSQASVSVAQSLRLRWSEGEVGEVRLTRHFERSDGGVGRPWLCLASAFLCCCALCCCLPARLQATKKVGCFRFACAEAGVLFRIAPLPPSSSPSPVTSHTGVLAYEQGNPTLVSIDQIFCSAVPAVATASPISLS
jgi:hypothetical protein